MLAILLKKSTAHHGARVVATINVNFGVIRKSVVVHVLVWLVPASRTRTEINGVNHRRLFPSPQQVGSIGTRIIEGLRVRACDSGGSRSKVLVVVASASARSRLSSLVVIIPTTVA